MKLSPALKVLLSALVLAAGAGAIWFLGYVLGKGALAQGDGSVFRAAFAFDETQLRYTVFLALLVTLTLQIVPASAGKWLLIAGVAYGAGVLSNSAGAPVLTVVLLVIATVGVAELSGTASQLIAAGVAGNLLAP